MALTYATEQEAYVESVAQALEQQGLTIFYAPYRQGDLWGEDLIPYLERVYRELAKLCVMFISKEYVEKTWPTHERRHALARQLESDSVYILPVRFDNTPVPGLPTSIHYVKAEDYTGTALAVMIVKKLEAAR